MLDNSDLSLAEKTIMLMTDILKWRDGLEAALQHGSNGYDFNDVVAKIIVGELHFYDFQDCCIIMQVIQFPRFTNYHCFAAAGTQEALDAAEHHMMTAGKALGCKHISISGRVGWERRLKPRGWKHMLSTLYKEIDL